MDSGWILVSPSRTASPDIFASSSTLTNHCRDNRGSIGSPERSEWPTECTYGRTSLTMRPCSASASRTATRASSRVMPSKRVPVSAMRPFSSMMIGMSRLWRRPIS